MERKIGEIKMAKKMTTKEVIDNLKNMSEEVDFLTDEDKQTLHEAGRLIKEIKNIYSGQEDSIIVEMITHFEAFLDKHNIRKQFLDNLFSRGSYHSIEELFKDNINSLVSNPRIIFYAHSFIWNDTPEGFDFWEGIRNKWVDCLENLLKENDYLKGFLSGVDFSQKKLNNEWISVEERFPEVYGRYLIKGKIGIEYLSYYFPDRKEWSSQCKVTHWKHINID